MWCNRFGCQFINGLTTQMNTGVIVWILKRFKKELQQKMWVFEIEIDEKSDFFEMYSTKCDLPYMAVASFLRPNCLALRPAPNCLDWWRSMGPSWLSPIAVNCPATMNWMDRCSFRDRIRDSMHMTNGMLSLGIRNHRIGTQVAIERLLCDDFWISCLF